MRVTMVQFQLAAEMARPGGFQVALNEYGYPTLERFWTKVEIEGLCWIWTGAKSGGGASLTYRWKKAVYGNFKVSAKWHRGIKGAKGKSKGQWEKAHRFAWKVLRGPIPRGKTLDHQVSPGPCTSTLCVNPAHVEPVTKPKNTANQNRRRAENRRKEQERRQGQDRRGSSSSSNNTREVES